MNGKHEENDFLSVFFFFLSSSLLACNGILTVVVSVRLVVLLHLSVAFLLRWFLAVGTGECALDSSVHKQRVFPFSKQFHVGLVHVQIQLGEIELHFVLVDVFAVDEKGNRVLGKGDGQGANGGRVVQRGRVQMLWKHLGIRIDIDGDTLRLSVQIECKFIFCGWKVNHEKCLDGDFCLPPGSVSEKRKWTNKRINKRI